MTLQPLLLFIDLHLWKVYASQWILVSRTMSDIQNLLVPLEHAIHECFIPAITGHPSCSSLEHSYLALPVRLGGLGITNPTETSAPAFLVSVKLTASLTDNVMIMSKGTETANHKSLQQKAEGIYKLLPPLLQRCFDQACEKGSSSWLSALPIADHGFHLNKGEFRDALCLRYDWSLPNVPQQCSCGKQFSANHAMTCHLGGFLTVRHNDIRDITASLLTQILEQEDFG